MALHRVFIPIVDADLSAGAGSLLWEAYCGPADAKERDSEDRHLDKNIVPAVAGLRPLGRYESGLRAYLAVRRLLAPERAVTETTSQTIRHERRKNRFKRLLWNISHSARRQRLEFALDNRRLRSGSLAKITGNSSDLGLALCLLMDVTQCRVKTLAATGELADAQDGKDARDLLVKPVAGVQAKLRLLIDNKKTGKLADDLNLVITPKQHILWRGEPACAVLERVENLPEVAELQGLGIRVCPVNSLAEAAKEAGIGLNIDKLGIGGIVFRAVGLAAAGLAFLLAYTLTGKIDVLWQSPRPSLAREPFLICPASGTTAGRYAGIQRDRQQIPDVKTASDLAWHIQVGSPVEARQWPYRLLHHFGYQGYHLALVTVGSKSGLGKHALWVPTTTQGNAEMRLNPGEIWKHHWVLDETAEENLLILLTSRARAFDVQALRAGFEARFGGDPAKLNFAAIEQYFLSQADGGLKFIFATRAEGAGCGNSPSE